MYYLFNSTALCDEEKEFYCTNGCKIDDKCRENHCIPKELFNDGKADCKYGSDEGM